MKAQSALSVKEANFKAMTAFIYTQGSATKQMFEHELGLQRGYRRANPNHTNHGHRH